MRNSLDPSIHRERERQVIEHVERLLTDDRLRLDTRDGRWPVVALRRDVRKEDREVELKRLMLESGIFDRDLQSRMPTGRTMTATLSRTRWFFFNRTIGRLQVLSLAPWRQLLEKKPIQPMSRQELQSMLSRLVPPPVPGDVPMTLVVHSTSGFAPEARELAESGTGRTVILIEPNDAGGWTVTAPPDCQGELFDPELDADKRERVRREVESHKADLLSGGLSAERLAAATKLPLPLVEEELRSFAREAGGLVARRLEGNIVLFREGTIPAAGTAIAGGFQMPFMQRLKTLFGGKADNEKKVALLSERRAALTVQRDRAFEEMGLLEQREAEMRQQFKDTTSTITKRRITSQLVQLRKDLERRQQLLGMLNQQINVIGTHLHNLELVQQGEGAQLPNSEELAADAAAAEEVLAELQASNELAGSIGATSPTGLSEEEQALYDELEKEAAGAEPAETPPVASAQGASGRAREGEVQKAEPPPLPQRERRGEAEAG